MRRSQMELFEILIARLVQYGRIDSIYVHICTQIDLFIYIYIYMCILIHTYIHTCMHTYIYVYIYITVERHGSLCMNKKEL